MLAILYIDENLAMSLSLLPQQRLEPLLHHLVHRDLPRDHAFWMQLT